MARRRSTPTGAAPPPPGGGPARPRLLSELEVRRIVRRILDIVDGMLRERFGDHPPPVEVAVVVEGTRLALAEEGVELSPAEVEDFVAALEQELDAREAR